ncbi:MAG: TolC family protein [Desulfuromonadales bacterium]|jgi:outer membrane protein, multidrug efflux system
MKHVMMRRLMNIILVMQIGLTGCAVGPDFQRPDMQMPDAYRTEVLPVVESAELSWWELFKDPALYTLVTTALENNRDIRIAISRIGQSRAALGFTRADQYPRIDISGSGQAGNYFGGSRSDETITSYSVTAPLTWELDFWGKYNRATEAARAELMASEFGLKSIQITLISDVVATYNRLLDYKRRLVIAQETLGSRSTSLEIIRQRFDKGIIAEIDLNQAQIQREIAASAIPSYRRAIAQSENSLNLLIGKFPGPLLTTSELEQSGSPPDIPVGMPSELLKRRPDIGQALSQLKAQTERIGVAEALRYPSINLTGSFGYASTELSSVTNDGTVWSAGVQLLGPILDFNKNQRRVEIEEEKTRQLLYRYENTLLNAFREVEDALSEIATYRVELASVDRQKAAAENANKLSRERYDKGVSSYLEVLETERALFNVALQRSELQQLYLNAYVKIYKALGGGWISEQEKELRMATEPEMEANQ